MSADGSEQALLSRGLRLLRVQKNPALALATLNEYAARYPFGLLAPESKTLTVEALIGLGRTGEAIAVLDDLLAQSLPGAGARRVLRAELQIGLGNHQSALGDLYALQVGKLPDAVLERLLWARAVANDHAGNTRKADADLDEYLRRFPNGRFAAAARSRRAR